MNKINLVDLYVERRLESLDLDETQNLARFYMRRWLYKMPDDAVISQIMDRYPDMKENVNLAYPGAVK